jgi:hypothetical protein
VTNNNGFWIWWLDLLNTRTFTQFGTIGNYSAIAILHTLQLTVAHALGFYVFISRILTTDLSQSHCNFKSHAKSSPHRLISYFPFVQPCSRQFRDSTRLLFYTPSTNKPAARSNSVYNHFARTMHRKHISRVRMRGADHIENTASIVQTLLLGFPRDLYPASSLARWLLPSKSPVLLPRV